METRENSDRYWNKYPRKAKQNEDKPESQSLERNKNKETDKSVVTPRERKTVDMLTSRTGGAYIPPAKLRLMQAEITDKSSAAYQRIAWEALKKSIHGCINKVNTSNIGIISVELLHENIVRGRGLLCKSLIQAQTASQTFTNVYAALVAVINARFPNIGELLLKRLVLQFKRGFKQNNKTTCISSATFIAHLVNQRVAHEILALEILTLLVESPTDDSVEVAIAFLKECGQKLTEVSRKGINAIFEMLRNILHEGQLEKRIQYMIEVMYQIRKDGFKDHAAVIQELDLVNEEEQFTHLITLEDVKQANAEDILNVFKFDDKYEENEGKYQMLSKEILGSDESGSEESGEEEGSEEEEEEDEEKAQSIIDNTSTNLTILRRTIYLTIQSSLDFEECAHKLMKMELKPGQEIEMCHMFLDCCAEQRTYEKFYGLLAQRFCQINKTYIEPFQQIFKNTFATTHRLDTNRIRNVSKFCAHLLYTDAISWEVLEVMKLNEEDSNSSSRVFIKILFQELAEYMGMAKLNARLKDPTLQPHFTGLFPRDNPKNTRFAINFFTSIGLGGLTDELREHLKSAPKITHQSLLAESSSSSDSDTSSSSDSGSDSDSESSDEDSKRNKKSRKGNPENDSVKSKDRLRRGDYEVKRKERDREEYEESRRVRRHYKDDGRERTSHGKETRSQPYVERRDRSSRSQKNNDRLLDEEKERVRDRSKRGNKERDASPEENSRSKTYKSHKREDSSFDEDRRSKYNRKEVSTDDIKRNKYDNEKKQKDYEWVKSRYEDNIKQLKNKKIIYEDIRQRRSRSRDKTMKKENRNRLRS